MTRKRSAGRDAIVGAYGVAANDAVQDPRFSMQRDGLMQETENGPKRICGHFEVMSETREDEGEQAWGLFLRFHDRDDKLQHVVLTRDQFIGEGVELRGALARRGLYVSSTKGAGAALCEYLSKVASPKRAKVVSRTGWHRIDNARVFVLPDEIFGQSTTEVIYEPALWESSLFNTAGTLEDWKLEVAARCVGNSRLMVAISTAFAAPLLDVVGEDGGGLHLRGASRTGKTTALRVGASVWGGEPGAGAGAYIRQWRVTSNAVEGVAAMHSDTLLALDELGQVDPKDVGATTYLLANGLGKSRMDRSARLRAPARFRALFISTGEVSLADKILEGGGSLKAGQEVRLVDFSADAGAGSGVFEDLHEADSAAAFAQVLRDATARCFGTAAPAFLRHLVEQLVANPELPGELRQWQETLVRDWLAGYPTAGGQVRSVARRFALIAVAGELATMACVTGWEPNEAAEAAHGCFGAWLSERGIVGSREDAQAVAQLRGFIARHGPARFEVWSDPLPAVEAAQGEAHSPPPERFRPVNRAGWRRWTYDEPTGLTGWDYFVLPEAMREALSGLDFKAALRVLVERGCIIPDRSGKSSRSASPPGHPKARVYLVPPSILRGDASTD